LFPLNRDTRQYSCAAPEPHIAPAARYHGPITKTAKQREGFCPQRAILLQKLTSALDDVLALYRRQQQAMIRGDRDVARFDQRLQKQAAKVQAARDTYWAHVKHHQC
jgi:hypothetical protein